MNHAVFGTAPPVSCAADGQRAPVNPLDRAADDGWSPPREIFGTTDAQSGSGGEPPAPQPPRPNEQE